MDNNRLAQMIAQNIQQGVIGNDGQVSQPNQAYINKNSEHLLDELREKKFRLKERMEKFFKSQEIDREELIEEIKNADPKFLKDLLIEMYDKGSKKTKRKRKKKNPKNKPKKTRRGKKFKSKKRKRGKKRTRRK